MTATSADAAATARPLWRRAVWAAVAVVAGIFLWHVLAEVNWPAVRAALQRRPGWELALIAVAALAGHAVYALLDVAGAASLGLALPRRRVWRIALLSYACNLNLGSVIGAAALRYRLYGAEGVAAADVSRLLALSMASNWLGYLVLFASLPLWPAGPVLARWIGATAAMLLSLGAALVVAGYFFACLRRTRWHLRGHEFRFPPWRYAAAQVAAALLSWALMAAALMLALDGLADYAQALGSLLVAAIAAAATHVPGGWGVLDFVLVRSLGGKADAAALIAAVLVYRAAYYLLPLALAALNLLLPWRRQGSTGRP